MQYRRSNGLASTGRTGHMPRHAAPPRFTPVGRAHRRAFRISRQPALPRAAWTTRPFLLWLAAAAIARAAVTGAGARADWLSGCCRPPPAVVRCTWP